MISRLSYGDVFRFAKRIPGLAAVAAVALIFTGLTQAQLKPTPIDSSMVRPPTAYAEIPAGARSVVSATLGKADKAYRAKSSGQGYTTENPANHLAAQYAADGVKIRLQNANLDIEFQGWGYGKPGVKEDQAAVAPLVDTNRVEYRRGALTEWYVNGPLGIEQGFTISQPPVRSVDSPHDALDIALRLGGNLTASAEPGGHAITLRDQRGVETLRYGPLLVYDASGRELESWMEVQDGSLRLRVNTAGARYPIIVDPWVQAAKLTASDGQSNDHFGISVTIGGTTANLVVVGAYLSTPIDNPNQGAAYVFVEPAGGWADWGDTSPYTKLTAANGKDGDCFGWSVGISGNTVVVGDPSLPGYPGCVAHPGAAYVFEEPSGGWGSVTSVNETAKLTFPGEGGGDGGEEFGYSVAIGGTTANTVVVGAYNTTVSGSAGQGEAYVFFEPGTSWASAYNTTELTASNGKPNDYLGCSVAISEDGSTVVAGAYGVNSTQGAAYVFEPTGGWASLATANETAELTTTDLTATTSVFGFSVGINENGNTVVVGASSANAGLGAAYVFVAKAGWATTSNWNAKLTASDQQTSDQLGSSVGISGNTIVAGAPGAKIGSNDEQGAAYVFVEPTVDGVPTWSTKTEDFRMYASDGAQSDYFGLAVGISGNTIVAGVPYAAVSSHTNQGAAYVFTQTTPPSFTLSANPASLTVAQGANGTSTITVDPATGFTGSVTLVASGLPTGVAAAFGTNPTTGTSVLTLTASMTAAPGGPATVTITGTSGALAPQTTTVSLTVTASYSASVGAATPASVSPGGSSTATVTLAAGTGYTGTVTLSCTISPVVSGATAPSCGFGNTSPVTVTAAGGSATMTFTTVGPSAALFQRPLSEIKGSMAIARLNPRARSSGTKLQFYALWLPIPGLALIGLGLGSRGSRRKKLLGLLLLGMILASLLILPACGSSSGTSGSSGTLAGAYTITITGKDANGVVQIGAAPTAVVTVN